MNPAKFLLAIILLANSFLSFGQEKQTKQSKRIIISDIFVQAGFINRTPTFGTLNDFKLLAPQSVLLNNDFSEYSKTFGWSLKKLYSISTGIKFRNKEKGVYKSNPILRLGVSYFSGSILSGGMYKFERKPCDTVYSTQTWQTIYIDSVTWRSYKMNYISDQIRFDGSFIFHSNIQTRFSLFTGLGITAGLSINTFTDIYYDKSDRTEDRGGSTRYYSSSMDISEKFVNKNNLGFSVYIPVGIDFRIGKKNAFWKQIHLFYELKPGINMTSIPELRDITNANFQHGVGLRVSWSN
ncbi:MAG: hypothetical protein HY841_04620 [Bacteroidetes bacterium]|nr:hypothetical protein [Bacteroidota bacterium]